MHVEHYQSEKKIKTHKNFIRMPTLMGQYKCPIQIGILFNLSVFWSTFLKNTFKKRRKKKDVLLLLCYSFYRWYTHFGGDRADSLCHLLIDVVLDGGLRRCAIQLGQRHHFPFIIQRHRLLHDTQGNVTCRYVSVYICLCVHRGWGARGRVCVYSACECVCVWLSVYICVCVKGKGGRGLYVCVQICVSVYVCVHD